MPTRVAAKFVMECMTGSWTTERPALIGGGVQGIIGQGGRHVGPGVSVMAAVLPGLEAS